MFDYRCPSDDDFDTRLRAEAFSWLTNKMRRGPEYLAYSEIQKFIFDGRPVPLKDRVKGIWKPAILSSALSITTTYRPPGVERPYDDLIHKSDGLLRYKWNGMKRDEATNRALRSAMEEGVPLIWFFAVGKGVFKPVFPVYAVAEEEEAQQFIVNADASHVAAQIEAEQPGSMSKNQKVKVRNELFSAVFRGTVMRAYRSRCAVCSFRHGPMLEATKIIKEIDHGAGAAVTNGIALCVFHRSALEVGALGIQPDLVVQVRPALMREDGGPMLRYGLQELHGKRISVPSVRAERPRQDLLERAFERFRQAD
ncbi:HNH endonuclease [Pseudarthrobacter enclensis]|uniref:Restriction endonuclease n=1 Tax=Pseudarthrobacter enclensis TaxID=993070 RepID=A0ABT9RVQ6_9MICC|nr:HNH endonuclease [Pseudarthrobacter enclensis]MDP9888294.1 putative restriction endonuclease [Pseudarthrobacter enclensis]